MRSLAVLALVAASFCCVPNCAHKQKFPIPVPPNSSMVTKGCTVMPEQVLGADIVECRESPDGEAACCLYGKESRDVGEGVVTKHVCVVSACRFACKAQWTIDNAACFEAQADPRQEASDGTEKEEDSVN